MLYSEKLKMFASQNVADAGLVDCWFVSGFAGFARNKIYRQQFTIIVSDSFNV